MPGWEQLGMQAAGQAVGAGMGLLLQGQQDRRQLKQQEKLQNLQIKGDKQLTDYNFMKQMEMWQNTNYPAQMAMLKKAGLNPALMYESGGQGSSTSITQGNVTGGNAPTGGGEMQGMMGMGLMNALQAAQIENIKANTEKTKAETGAVAPGIEKTKAETGEIGTRTINIAQDTKNKEAQEQLTNLQTENTKVQTEYIAKDFNQRQQSIDAQIRHIDQTITNLKTQNKIDDIEANNRDKLLKADLALKIIEAFKRSQEYSNLKAEHANILNKLSMDIQKNMREWDQLGQKNREINIDWYKDSTDDAPDIVGKILAIVGLGSILKGNEKPTTIGGFHKR